MYYILVQAYTYIHALILSAVTNTVYNKLNLTYKASTYINTHTYVCTLDCLKYMYAYV